MFFVLAHGAVAAETFAVTVSQIDDRKAVFATVQSVDQTVARTQIGGTIRELTVDEGAPVFHGQIIARVHDPKLALQISALQARKKSLEAQLKLATIEMERARDLRRSGVGSQARLDDAQTQLDVVTSDLAALKAEIKVIEQQVTEGDVLAPTDGRVLKVHVTDGSVVLPGDIVATIATETYILRLHLPERHARYISPDDRVLVGTRGMETVAQDLVEGRVRQVYPEMEDGRVVADVEVHGLGDFFVGERTRVYVATGKREAIIVPEGYIYQRFGVSFARLENGKEVAVRVGLPVDGGLEILAGLRPGDVLVRP